MSLIQEDQLETFFQRHGPDDSDVRRLGRELHRRRGGARGTCGYIGKVADDDFGQRFTHDLTSMGVEVDLAIAAADEGATGRWPRVHHR